MNPIDPLATCPKCRRCAEWCWCTFTEDEIKVSPEFLAAADIEADTPITIRPPVDPEEIRFAREAYARGEGVDVGDVLREIGVEFKEK